MKIEPYFLKNKDWYEIKEIDTEDELSGRKKCYILTSKAPQKAIESYNEFYAERLINDGDSLEDLTIMDY